MDRRSTEAIRLRDLPPCSPTSAAPRLAVMFVVAFFIQSFHMIEHVAQVIQAFVFRSASAHGLIGEVLDREWLHFAFNAPLLVLLAALFLGFREQCWHFKAKRTIYYTFLSGIVIQAYHVVEHSVKVIQYAMSGFRIEPQPGILGNFVNLVSLHFVLNLLVYIPILVGFFGYGFYKRGQAR